MVKLDLDAMRTSSEQWRARYQEIVRDQDRFEREYRTRHGFSLDDLKPTEGAIDTGDVILCRSRMSLTNRLGQGLLRGSVRPSPFSHAAICLNKHFVIDAVPCKKLWPRPISVWLDHYDLDRSVVLRPPRDRLPSRAVMLERILFKTGRKYDLLRLFGIRLGTKRRAFYCSEYVVDVFNSFFDNIIIDGKYLPADLESLLGRADFVPASLREALDPECSVLLADAPANWSAGHPFDAGGPIVLAHLEDVVRTTAVLANAQDWMKLMRVIDLVIAGASRAAAGDEQRLTMAFEFVDVLPQLVRLVGAPASPIIGLPAELIEDRKLSPQSMAASDGMIATLLVKAAVELKLLLECIRLLRHQADLSDNQIVQTDDWILVHYAPLVLVACRKFADGAYDVARDRLDSMPAAPSVLPPLNHAIPLARAIVRASRLIGEIFAPGVGWFEQARASGARAATEARQSARDRLGEFLRNETADSELDEVLETLAETIADQERGLQEAPHRPE